MNQNNINLPSIDFEMEVPFYDIDPMNIVWHGNYVKYLEKARCVLLEQFGYGYLDMKSSGYIWPIVDMRLKYINSASFGQILVCNASLVEYENRIKIKYLISCKETGKKLTKAYTVQVAVNIENQELQLVSPPILQEKLSEYL